MKPCTIFEDDRGQYHYADWTVEIHRADELFPREEWKPKFSETVRRMKFVDIEDDVHERVLDILDNHMILTANLRAIFNSKP